MYFARQFFRIQIHTISDVCAFLAAPFWLLKCTVLTKAGNTHIYTSGGEEQACVIFQTAGEKEIERIAHLANVPFRQNYLIPRTRGGGGVLFARN